ncbi:uncharacterized protein LOC143452056 isoform X2 [Clavelina lepadiformis]|uniref:uncharacterized protein LOC143452056 isoform X2 n=1 Tax=Clavelina lepadiformis TaxID=159417 RepID=UPI0040434F14
MLVAPEDSGSCAIVEFRRFPSFSMICRSCPSSHDQVIKICCYSSQSRSHSVHAAMKLGWAGCYAKTHVVTTVKTKRFWFS